MVYSAEDVFLGDEDVVEDEFAGVGAAHTELVKLARAGAALSCGGDDEGCDAFGASVGFCFSVYDYGVRVWTLFSDIRL